MSPEALARVLAVIAVGRRIEDRADALGREARARLPGHTGLSPESIDLALNEHLETHPSPDELGAFLGRAGHAPRCHVVLSANVCTAALRAIAFACATAPAVFVKPSRRDPVVAELVVRGLAASSAFAKAGGEIHLVTRVAPEPGDEVHVYGSDETISAIRAALPEGAVLRAHGTGLGIAVVESNAALDHAASSLAQDVAVFDQRGCLSPRIALVGGGAARALDFARFLADDLAEWHRRSPRGALDPATLAELRRYVDTAAALGDCFEGEGFVVGLDEAPSALVLPPAARALHVVPVAAPENAALLLAPWADKIAAIGAGKSGPLLQAVLPLVPRARLSPLGFMQRPPFDGPVDLRSVSTFTSAGERLHQRW